MKSDFLSHFPDHVFQVFNDAEGGGGLTLPNATTPAQLKRLNNLGKGIFFSINRFPGGVRQQQFCTGVNAWFAECDHKTKEQQWAALEGGVLQPHLIVGSKKSLHMYWLADSSATIENFSRIQMGLAKRFDGDTTMKDISKVLRVPGYYHLKDPYDPWLVIQHQDMTSMEEPYSEAEMLAEFPYEEVTPPPAPYVRRPLPAVTDEGYFWEVLRAIDNKAILERLSGDAWCNYEVFTFRPRSGGGEYIDVNGKPANAWLDKDGMIGSGTHAGPTWIEWLRWYGVSYAEIARWAKNDFNK